MCGGEDIAYADLRGADGLSPRVRGRDIPNITVGVVCTDYHESAANKDHKDKPITKQGRRSNSPKNHSSLVVEQIGDNLAVNVENLGKRIRDKRVECSLSLTRLGRLLSVDRTTVREWEAGKATPRSSNLKRILEWLDEPV